MSALADKDRPPAHFRRVFGADHDHLLGACVAEIDAWLETALRDK